MQSNDIKKQQEFVKAMVSDGKPLDEQEARAVAMVLHGMQFQGHADAATASAKALPPGVKDALITDGLRFEV